MKNHPLGGWMFIACGEKSKLTLDTPPLLCYTKPITTFSRPLREI